MNNKYQQRLYWSISRPLKYMGLTIDEMLVTLLGLGLSTNSMLDHNMRLGLFFFIVTVTICWFLKKWKRLSANFKLKSFLVAKNILPAPKKYPQMLNKEKVGK